jgi:hypothetical protein
MDSTKITHGLESRIKVLEEIDRRVSRLELRMQASFVTPTSSSKPPATAKLNDSQALLAIIETLLTEIEEVDTLVGSLEQHFHSLRRLAEPTQEDT